MPEYDDLFDMEALDRFTRELTEGDEAPEEKLAKEKAAANKPAPAAEMPAPAAPAHTSVRSAHFP